MKDAGVWAPGRGRVLGFGNTGAVPALTELSVPNRAAGLALLTPLLPSLGSQR